MPEQMFREVATPPAARRGGAARSIAFSVVTHAGAVVVLIIAPLVATGALPTPNAMLAFAMPLPPALEVPVAPKVVRVQPAQADTPAVDAAPVPDVVAPTVPIEPLPPPPPSMAGVTTMRSGIPEGLPTSAVTMAPPPPHSATPSGPIPVGGQVKEPKILLRVSPIYPEFAKLARVSGRVILEAIIDAQGRVQDVKVISSVKLLDQAAIDAVRQWRYSPTLLNGTPVSVILTVMVTFSLR